MAGCGGAEHDMASTMSENISEVSVEEISMSETVQGTEVAENEDIAIASQNTDGTVETEEQDAAAEYSSVKENTVYSKNSSLESGSAKTNHGAGDQNQSDSGNVENSNDIVSNPSTEIQSIEQSIGKRAVDVLFDTDVNNWNIHSTIITEL